MKLRDAEKWGTHKAANTDEYGSAVIRYAERWADMMEAAVDAGAKLEDIAESTSREADTEGITGFMYGAAVWSLAEAWQHGEQLRRWHNLATEIGDEGKRANETGGVLNPAMLNLGGAP